MTGSGRNLTDALRFREGIGLFMMISGINAVARPTMRKVSTALGNPQPDVLIPGQWALETSARIHYKFAEDVASAQNVADAAGLPHAAVVQHRSGKLLGDSFVVMTLDTFAALIAPG